MRKHCKKIRKEKGLSQAQLANKMFVNDSTVTRWETGSRLPDAAMIARLARVLEVDASTLLSTAAESDESPNIIMVDDNKAVIADSLFVLVVYLTSYPDYSLDAWDTDACGFMVKPLTPEGVRRQLKKLHYPFSVGGTDK